NYEIVKTLMEVDNFISYQVAQIYFDNTDWPGNNIKYWRPKIPEGRWRWIIYDTDFGFGIWNESNYLNNTLAFALEENGPDWPNPPWSTFLLRKLLENEEFKFAFINRFADYMNTIFKADMVNDRIDEMQQAVEPEMSAHFSRWGGSVSDWNNNVNVLRTFANNRVTYLRLHIMNQFGISGLSLVNINVNSIEYGDVQLNSIVPENYPWNGYYFNQVPVTVEAIPKIGYRFSGWTGTVTSDDPIIEVIIDQNIDLTAHFEIDPANDLNIVINEFNYNSTDDFNPEDWVEFYNKGENDVEMGGWIFKDEEDIHSFIFPENLILPPGGYIIICMDTVLFKNLFPDVNCISGQADFGLSGGGELIRLYNNEGYMIDSLIYDDVYPWPPEADGNGPTVALKDPEWDNSLPESWAASYGHGTPGVENDVLGIDVEGNKIPEKFCIKQNYPNPFNPETFIEFQLAGKSFVVMEVYDIIGRKIETLIHENLPAGYHKVKWKPAQSLGSGIYFYRI
ncbi:MAG: CotH kinase family protein, partial [Calditrichia bacterium]|nr:CotH kinase family protein [Calditrichia bacterium]